MVRAVPSDLISRFSRPNDLGLVIGLLLGAAAAWLVLRAQYASRVSALDEARASLGSTLKALAADALATNNQSFLELAQVRSSRQLQQRTTQELEQRKQAVEHLVTPITESLQKVDGKLQQLEVARTRAYSELSVQVRQLAERQIELRSEDREPRAAHCATGRTSAAAGARSSSGGSSRWPGCSSTATSRRRPTWRRTTSRLAPISSSSSPARKTVVVDAKFPGQAYLESLSAAHDEERLAEAPRSRPPGSRPHREALGKSYWAQFDAAPEFVVLFIPGETFLSAPSNRIRR